MKARLIKILLLDLLLCFSVLKYPDGYAQLLFSDITEEAGISCSGLGRGTAWGDINNDGFDDLLITFREGYGNLLCLNNGDGTFSDVTEEWGVAFKERFTVCGYFVDYNNDGYLDLYLGTAWLYLDVLLKNIGEKFIDVTSQMGIFGEDYATNAVVFFDCDNDGLLDIFIGNYRGGNIHYLNHEGYIFIDVSESSGIGPGSYGYVTRSAAAADYDDDGDMDLFLGNSLDQPNFLYQNLGNLKFQEVSHDAGILGEAWSNASVWADYNNDGLIDLFVGNEKSSSCLYTNLGNGTFRNDIVNARLGNNLRSSNALFADFDNDGFLDLYIIDDNGNSVLYHNNVGSSFTDISTESGLVLDDYCNSAGTSDYDHDGDLDLFVTSKDGISRLYRNNIGNMNNYLEIRLKGKVSNKSAIGTRIKVIAGELSQIREVQSSSGYTSQNSLTAFFGLSEKSKIDTINIRWPSGINQKFIDVKTNQIIFVTEIDTSSAVDSDDLLNKPYSYHIYQNYPNPFNSTCTITYQIPEDGNITIFIYNLTGQKIKALVDGFQKTNYYQITWDGTDDYGNKVVSGVYLCQMNSGNYVGMRKMILLE